MDAFDVKESFDQLQATERQVLQMISVCFDPVKPAELKALCERAGIFNDAVKPVSASSPAVWEALEAKGWLELDDGYFIAGDLGEYITQSAVVEGAFERCASAVTGFYASFDHYRERHPAWDSLEELLRDLRICVYRGDLKGLRARLAVASRGHSDSFYESVPSEEQILLSCLNHPFDADLVADLAEPLRSTALGYLLARYCDYLIDGDDLAPLARSIVQETNTTSAHVRACLFDYFLLSGSIESAREVLDEWEDYALDCRRGILRLLDGDAAGAVVFFRSALEELLDETQQPNGYFRGWSGVFYVLALIALDTPGSLEQAREIVSGRLIMMGRSYGGGRRRPFVTTYEILDELLAKINFSREQPDVAVYVLDRLRENVRPIELLLSSSILRCVDINALAQLDSFDGILEEAEDTADLNGYAWYAREMRTVRKAAGVTTDGPDEHLPQHSRESTLCLTPVLPLYTQWRRSLKALAELGTGLSGKALRKSNEAPQKKERVAWTIRTDGDSAFDVLDVQPIVQKRNKSGKWTRGSRVSVNKLIEGNIDAPISQHDVKAAQRSAALWDKRYSYNYPYGSQGASLVLEALVGHPHLFWEDDPARENPIELSLGTPTLQIQEASGGRHVQLSLSPPPPRDDSGLAVEQSGKQRLSVVKYNKLQLQAARILGSSGLRVPHEAVDEVAGAAERLANTFAVRSTLALSAGERRQVDADAVLRVRFAPWGPGLSLTVVVTPLGAEGPSFPSGDGPLLIYGHHEGEAVAASRDLATERDRLKQICAACPLLTEALAGTTHCDLADPIDCLEVIAELTDFGDGVILEWPEGESWRMKTVQSFDGLALRMEKKNNWLEVVGELNVDEDRVLSIAQLIELLGKSRGRFLRMDDGMILAITNEMRRQLRRLSLLTQTKQNALRADSHALMALKDVADDLPQVTLDAAMSEQVAAVESAFSQTFEVSQHLNGTMRPYQEEGFQWMSRLAAADLGACLADDMGLGKTIQAIAVLQNRVTGGPALVVAPTSVCPNWVVELARFAPELKPRLFGEGNREAQLESLGPGAVLICSYGLLITETERLSKVQWSSVVLDEAQSIKNHLTRRAKAARELNAGFKLVLTGTPVENRLMELWSLMDFINPGLLGDHRAFHEFFVVAIEQDGNAVAREVLKDLIRPFVLRRTKEAVLAELPAKTEIVRHVKLGDAEMAFYEAQRRHAIERLKKSSLASSINILTELTLLRRACCNPALVTPGIDLPSAKLAEFESIVDELLENEHKALVFSQFVDHLTIVRALLDKKGIRYQYLDGSTPSKKRQQSIAAFQAGEGELFLISLKAGGLGLNLTAANYVIHLDPWWNPAAENQATDRAHRMGQDKPVTVYRLVAQGTIEEKIVALHETKKALADQLLEGSDVAGRLKADELLAVLKEL